MCIKRGAAKLSNVQRMMGEHGPIATPVLKLKDRTIV